MGFVVIALPTVSHLLSKSARLGPHFDRGCSHDEVGRETRRVGPGTRGSKESKFGASAGAPSRSLPLRRRYLRSTSTKRSSVGSDHVINAADSSLRVVVIPASRACWTRRSSQRCVRASAGRRQAGGGGVDEPGSVRGLTCSRGSQRGSQSDKKARCRAGNGPVSWARSEGLEPPTF